jgi:hypothetical protein
MTMLKNEIHTLAELLLATEDSKWDSEDYQAPTAAKWERTKQHEFKANGKPNIPKDQ